MATKKPAPKKTTAKTAKKPVKVVKKSATKMKLVKPAAKKTSATKKPTKAKPMAKMVVDRMTLPKGGKVFVKVAERPMTKKPSKKAK